ncbi:7622_t:CDS:2 [Diversispora eburnea]|uniref:7622_t:CDS:1 n=1 Tax=Diversispora eburnea TaxID=1213867 RepID=A0A9N8Z7R3_9GLOM|nr:7622_t:CDS:2 [Diversispora eburnea]
MSRNQKDSGNHRQIIFHNDVLVSKLDHSLLRNPPYKLTLTIEELTKPSHREEDSDNKVPRPPNGFILYRKNFGAKVKLTQPKLRVQDISKMSSKEWQKEDPLVKSFFKILAEIQGENHNKEYPDYKYNPKKNIENRKSRINKRTRPKSKKLNIKNIKKKYNNNNKETENSNSVENNNANNGNVGNISNNIIENNINNNIDTLNAISALSGASFEELTSTERDPNLPKFFLVRRGSFLSGNIQKFRDPSKNIRLPSTHPQPNPNYSTPPPELLQNFISQSPRNAIESQSQ